MLPPASIYCEDRAVAVMRRNWNRNDERIGVLFPGRKCVIELVASGQVAASGVWEFEITQQGQQLQPVSDWESSCWYTDGDVDYLELEIALSGGVKLQRQIVLAREDRFLFLADAVIEPASWQFGIPRCRAVVSAGRIPRGRREPRGAFGAASSGNCKREIHRRGEGGRPSPCDGNGEYCRVAWGVAAPSLPRPLAQVLPLGMPEWRAEKHDGDLKMIGEGLELRQSAAGQRLFAPLFIDLDRRRFRRRMTWRRLTVAEWLKPMPPEVAVGYRVAIGDRQWIIYRSLAACANRTLLGHNLATESLIARFGKDGEVTSIVEIE